jgi:hypothetical protein
MIIQTEFILEVGKIYGNDDWYHPLSDQYGKDHRVSFVVIRIATKEEFLEQVSGFHDIPKSTIETMHQEIHKMNFYQIAMD